jgi:hypothetical protein
MDGDRHAAAKGIQEHRQFAVHELALVERTRQRFAHPPSLAHAGDERLVHLPARLVRHAEGSVPKPGGDILRSAAEPRHLVVVNRPRSIHRDVRDDAAPHEVEEERRDTGLDDVATEHDDDGAVAARGLGDRLDHLAKRAGDEDVGEGTQKRAERAIRARRHGELLGANLVRPSGDGDRADGGEIDLRRRYWLPAVVVAVVGRNDLRYRLRVPKESFDFICSIMRRSSSDSQICASPFSEKIPLDLMIGWMTIASNLPAGT